MKQLFALIACLGLCCSAWATDRQISTINDIKKSREYLYGEATMPTLEEATSLAYELLQNEVLDWASDRVSRPIGNFSARELNKLADTIVTRRADMFRVFAYVRKRALVPMFYDKGIVLLDSLDFGKADASEQQAAGQPSAPAQGDSLANASVLQQIRSKMFPTAPAETSPRPEAPNQVGSQTAKPMTKKEIEIIDRLRKARNFFDLKNVLPRLKQDGLIANYGKLATAEHLEECHLIVYDAAGNIKALLGRGEETRPNLNTGTDDTLDNYRGCGALWVMIIED